jgi:hypothetical protein
MSKLFPSAAEWVPKPDLFLLFPSAAMHSGLLQMGRSSVVAQSLAQAVSDSFANSGEL